MSTARDDIISVALFVGILSVCAIMVYVPVWISFDHADEARAVEACSPDEFIGRLDSKGHLLAVCNTPQGIVVRDAKK